MSSVQENHDAFARFYDALNDGDQARIDEVMAEVIHPDVALNTPLPTQAPGAEGLRMGLEALRTAFPDFHLEVEDAVGEGDLLFTRNTITGTHEGVHFGHAPTGKSFEIEEMILFRFDGGRVVEIKGVVDVLGQLQQLGLQPA